MDIDKHLDKIQEDNIQEIDPFVTGGIIGLGYAIASFITFLLSAAELKRRIKVSPELSKRINKILKTNDWAVHVAPDPNPNAFAIGGKHIFVTTGLIKLLSPREVDAVMLHGVYHNKKKHIYKQMAHDYPLFYLILVTSLTISIVTGTYILGILAFLIIKSISSIPYNILIGKRQETKADEFAIQHGYGMELKSALQKIEREMIKTRSQIKCGRVCQAVRKIDEAIDEHPPLAKRIENVLKKTNELNKTLKTTSFRKIKDFVVDNIKKG